MKEDASPLIDKTNEAPGGEGFSLLEHCKKCKSSCCHDKYFVPANSDRDAILAAGHPDHFEKVQMETSTYYLLNYAGKMCPYSAPDGTCSVEAVKPMVCRTFPAALNLFFHGKPGHNGMHFVKYCPAVEHLTNAFLDNAKPLLKKNEKEMPWAMQQAIRQAYREQYELKNNGS